MIVDVHSHCLKPEHWGDEFHDHWKPAYGMWARPFDGYLALVNAIEWGATGKLLFGSDFPLWTPAVAQQGLRDLAVRLGGPFPPIDGAVVEGTISRDSCSLLGLSPR